MALVACGSTTTPLSQATLQKETQEPEAGFQAPPPLVATVAAPKGLRTLTLPEQSDIDATATAQGHVTALPTEAILSAGLIPSPTPASHTPAPGPTFTPPAPPESSPWDHYWLNRPVPAGSAVWTDKAYPYGDTRGGTLRTHHGVEFNVPAGSEVMAAAAGRVVVAGDDSSVQMGAFNNFYGNVVVIEVDALLGDQPIFTLYGHLSDILVTAGEQVQARQVIALSGASGVADGAHLHFEVRVGQNSYDATRNPLLWLYPFPDRGVVAGRVTWPNGDPATGVPVSLRRLDAPSPYAATATYADDTVNPDDNWAENFVLDDVAAGFYELTSGSAENRTTAKLWVYPYRTSFVEVVLPG